MLSDGSIRRAIAEAVVTIDPEPEDHQYQPASVDLNLGLEFTDPQSGGEVISYRPNGDFRRYIDVLPGQCLLACTWETITLPEDLVARVEGKSSWGRRFLMVHSTAGFIDPGFTGQITLELCNLSRTTVTLTIGEPIAQISFDTLDHPAQRPYGHPELRSRYQGQRGATPARPWTTESAR